MRTTLTLDKDNAHKLSTVQARTGKSRKSIINETLRAGFAAGENGKVKRKPFKVKPYRLHLREGLSLDNIGELLAQVEGEDYK